VNAICESVDRGFFMENSSGSGRAKPEREFSHL
jgi:hypothetical protein